MKFLVLFLALLAVVKTATGVEEPQLKQSDGPAPKLPVFPNNYYARGHLSLPYAQIREPYEAWFDKESGRSRNDFYGDLYKIYQFGPRKPTGHNGSEDFGVMFKLAYVPANFKPTKQSETLINKVKDSIISHVPSFLHKDDASKSTKTRRACFKIEGGVGFTVSPQTVLPDMHEFTFQGIGNCPHKPNGGSCECWKKVTSMGDKVNTYKMWLSRGRNNHLTPILYTMTGYNNIFGSHYDRYEIFYEHFEANATTEEDFRLDEGRSNCEPMPGPGFASNSGERRFHLVAANPFHEYIQEPHRYDHIDDQFDKFAKEHQKEYPSDKHLHEGWHNFLHNLRFIHSKNRELKAYKLGVNQFADYNSNDLSFLRGRISTTKKGESNGGKDYNQHHQHLRSASGELKEKLPSHWFWNISTIRDQATCGSCYAFAAVGSVEGAFYVKTGRRLNLSTQNIIDCSWAYLNNGCDGGEDFRVYQYIMAAGGLSTEDDYGHYLGADGKCHDAEVNKSVKLSGWYNVTTLDRQALKHAIVNSGPTAISLNAEEITFTFYSNGIYNNPKCKNGMDQLDHAVLAVGYMEVEGEFVWIVKNSWSINWGDKGYILISDGSVNGPSTNICGVLDAPTVPIIDI